MNILIYIAMQSEADPIIDGLSLLEQHNLLPPALPMRSYTGKDEHHQYLLVSSGLSAKHEVDNIGSEAAAVGLQAALSVYDADLVINAGTAGGFAQRGAAIADVYLGTGTVCYHDHRIDLPKFDAYGVGDYACVNTDKLAQKLGLKQGRISTGCSLGMTAEDLAQMQKNQADCKEMEAAALAWIASLHKTPFLPIKAITDLLDVEVDTPEQFMANLTRSNLALKEVLINVLKSSHLIDG